MSVYRYYTNNSYRIHSIEIEFLLFFMFELSFKLWQHQFVYIFPESMRQYLLTKYAKRTLLFVVIMGVHAEQMLQVLFCEKWLSALIKKLVVFYLQWKHLYGRFGTVSHLPQMIIRFPFKVKKYRVDKKFESRHRQPHVKVLEII